MIERITHQDEEESTSPLKSVSPFLSAPSIIPSNHTAPSIIHLKRDQHSAIILKPDTPGQPPLVLQTRFGEFPHRSFIGFPYGSQVRASAPTNSSRKRKRPIATESSTPAESTEAELTPTPATTGFVHVLAPTAELWTSTLPHRTQVVYTPDSSYILHRLNVTAGSSVIEAGAGSGSFSHAAVRALYSGYPDSRQDFPTNGRKLGKLWSFEFHSERAEKLREEIEAHGLDSLIEITHKDVCAEGFLAANNVTPRANAVFLDLPAPWLALKRLTRGGTKSPLNPDKEVHICTFSPCIEQVTRTVNTLREMGWMDVQTVELAHQRIEVRRQGGNDMGGPKSIADALMRLKEVNDIREARKDFQSALSKGDATVATSCPGKPRDVINAQRRRKTEEGKILTRNEPDIKSHTSYLTFAVLPREWTPEMEADTEKWVKENVSQGAVTAIVGEKEKRWKDANNREAKGGVKESKRARKKRERGEKKARESNTLDGSELTQLNTTSTNHQNSLDETVRVIVNVASDPEDGYPSSTGSGDRKSVV